MKSSRRWAVDCEPNIHDSHFCVANWTLWNRTPILIYPNVVCFVDVWDNKKNMVGDHVTE